MESFQDQFYHPERVPASACLIKNASHVNQKLDHTFRQANKLIDYTLIGVLRSGREPVRVSENSYRNLH